MSAELRAASTALTHGVYLSKLFAELINTTVTTTPKRVHILKCDSRCVIDSVNVHSRVLPQDRGLALPLADLRDLKRDEQVTFLHVSTHTNLADELTKPLLHSKF